MLASAIQKAVLDSKFISTTFCDAVILGMYAILDRRGTLKKMIIISMAVKIAAMMGAQQQTHLLKVVEEITFPGATRLYSHSLVHVNIIMIDII